MGKKKSLRRKPTLIERIAAARKKGQTAEAVNLTVTLAKDEKSDANIELLRQVTMEHGMALRAEGKPHEAKELFTRALQLGGSPDFIATVLLSLLSCGEIKDVGEALPRVTDPELRQTVEIRLNDVAIAKGREGRAFVSDGLKASFDLIQQASEYVEQGRDEDAKAALQGIGLQSPFLEWKVFLRGLLAYYSNDDQRAIENWQRLDPRRLPSRVAAPMRVSIDPAFAKEQAPAVQQKLRVQLLSQQGLQIAPLLDELRSAIHQKNLAPAFRKIEEAIPAFRRDFPEHAHRLARVFAWAIIDHGHPEDLTRYLRVFGSPGDDPNLNRLQALALEHRGLLADAHKAWHDLLGDIAKDPKQWPGELGSRIQGMIWRHMAENALAHEREAGPETKSLFAFVSRNQNALKPTAETCLERAVAFLPDSVGCQRALFEIYRKGGKIAKAQKLGEEMFKRFPKDALVLKMLAELYTDQHEFLKALECLEKAMQLNPFDREIPGEMARLRQLFALQLALEKQFAEARAQFEKAVSQCSGSKTSLLCQWAVCEWKAKNPERAEELVAQAQAQPNQRLACGYALVGESVRAKLPPKEKKRLAENLKSAFSEPATPAEILALIGIAAQQRRIYDDAFTGQKTQEKTILKFLDTLHFDAFSEAELVELAEFLKEMKARKPWFACLNFARRRFLKNPHIRLSLVDYYLLEQTNDPKVHLAKEHLDAARQLVQAMPRGEAQQQLLECIQAREEIANEMAARHRSIMGVFDQIFGGFEGDDDQHQWEYDDDEDAPF